MPPTLSLSLFLSNRIHFYIDVLFQIYYDIPLKIILFFIRPIVGPPTGMSTLSKSVPVNYDKQGILQILHYWTEASASDTGCCHN